jgi:hypothetical protein
MPSDPDWRARLNAVDWSQFHTIYGGADTVPAQIERMHSPDETKALSAAGDLVAGLCHRHVQIASAALPAFPFIIEMLTCASEKLAVAILEMLAGFAITTDPVRMRKFASAVGKRRMPPPAWVDELRKELQWRCRGSRRTRRTQSRHC